MGDDHLEIECEKRNCIPADLYSIAAMNEEDMTFADDRPNLTHWKGPDGKWYRLIFDRRESIRRVQVVCNNSDVDGPVWAACSPRIIEIPLSPSELVSSDPLDGR